MRIFKNYGEDWDDDGGPYRVIYISDTEQYILYLDNGTIKRYTHPYELVIIERFINRHDWDEVKICDNAFED